MSRVTISLLWIVGSALFIPGGAYKLFQEHLRLDYKHRHHSTYHIKQLRQTGPLATGYLAELMGLCVDRPMSIYQFDLDRARANLLKSPLIKEATIRARPPQTLTIDYVVRTPLARVYDYENLALDEEGHLFPFHPFFSQKIPEVYLALPFNQPLKGRGVDLALTLLKQLSSEELGIVRIDVSQAFAESYGQREIVLMVEDELIHRGVRFVIPRYLRLSPKNYLAELGNYLNLRTQLLEKEKKQLKTTNQDAVVRLPAMTIDFRIAQLAFIE